MPHDAAMAEPIWLSVARLLVGIREIPGPQSNPVILNWARYIGAPAWYHDDDQAWCTVSMNALLKGCQRPMAGTGYALLRAKTFESYGQQLLEPALGAILVFSRDLGGHVGLYLGETETHFFVWGANQGNAVSMAWIEKGRLTAIRWPLGVPLPTGGRVFLRADGSPVSTNEA